MNHAQKMDGFRVTRVQSCSVGAKSTGYESRCRVLGWVVAQAWDQARHFCRRYPLRGRAVADRRALLDQSADSEQEGVVSATLDGLVSSMNPFCDARKKTFLIKFWQDSPVHTLCPCPRLRNVVGPN